MKSLAFALLLSPLVALAQVSQLTVEQTKKTTKTGDSGTPRIRTTNFVDRVVLNVGLSGEGPADVACYFVARSPRTHAMRYHGFKTERVGLSRVSKSIKVESEPAAYSQLKRQDSTPEEPSGIVPFGWVVIVSQKGQESAAKASSPEVLAWVRKNPPTKAIQVSP